MNQINDCAYAAAVLAGATGGDDQYNDALLVYFLANGATTEIYNTAEREFLIVNGATDGELNDMWEEVLVTLGYEGSLPDMLYEFWCVGQGSIGPAPVPTVVSTVPVNLATDVGAFSTIQWVFSERMDPTTMILSNLQVLDGSTPIDGVITYDIPSQTATFTPTDGFPGSTVISFTASVGCTSTRGEPLAVKDSRTMTTGVRVDHAMIETFVRAYGNGWTDQPWLDELPLHNSIHADHVFLKEQVSYATLKANNPDQVVLNYRHAGAVRVSYDGDGSKEGDVNVSDNNAYYANGINRLTELQDFGTGWIDDRDTAAVNFKKYVQYSGTEGNYTLDSFWGLNDGDIGLQYENPELQQFFIQGVLRDTQNAENIISPTGYADVKADGTWLDELSYPVNSEIPPWYSSEALMFSALSSFVKAVTEGYQDGGFVASPNTGALYDPNHRALTSAYDNNPPDNNNGLHWLTDEAAFMTPYGSARIRYREPGPNRASIDAFLAIKNWNFYQYTPTITRSIESDVNQYGRTDTGRMVAQYGLACHLLSKRVGVGVAGIELRTQWALDYRAWVDDSGGNTDKDLRPVEVGYLNKYFDSVEPGGYKTIAVAGGKEILYRRMMKNGSPAGFILLNYHEGFPDPDPINTFDAVPLPDGFVAAQEITDDDYTNDTIPSTGISEVDNVRGNTGRFFFAQSFLSVFSKLGMSPDPTAEDSGDGGSYEMGCKFTTQVKVTIVGVRFFKHALNTGPRTVTIWLGGTSLHSETVTGETASGWQECMFATPFSAPLDGSIFNISIGVPNGHYSFSPDSGSVPGDAMTNGFTDGNITLEANLAAGVGVNMAYDVVIGTRPNNGSNATNYWIEPLYEVD